MLQSSFQNDLMDLQSLQGTDSLVDRRQLFVSLDRIDSEIRDGSFSHRFDAFETKQPCGAGSQTCAATALVRRVYLPEYVSTRYHTQYSGSVRLTVLTLRQFSVLLPVPWRNFGLVEITWRKHVIMHDHYYCAAGSYCWCACALIIG